MEQVSRAVNRKQ